jgi:nucleotide-binding universal stress UspA family protein
MYRKILITTDGSAVSQHTACAGVKFAQQMGAEVLALFVAPDYQYPVYVEIIPPSYPSEEEYVAQMRRMGEDYMGKIMRSAEQCGLKHSLHDGLFRLHRAENRRRGRTATLRPDLHGLARAQRLGPVAAGQRHEQSAVAYDQAGAGAPADPSRNQGTLKPARPRAIKNTNGIC